MVAPAMPRPRAPQCRGQGSLHSHEQAVQTKKDAGTFGKMFERGDLIRDAEVEEAQSRQVDKENYLSQFTEEERQAAQAKPLSLDGPRCF